MRAVLVLNAALAWGAAAAADLSPRQVAAEADEALVRGDDRMAVNKLEWLKDAGRLTLTQRIALAEIYLRLGYLDDAEREAEAAAGSSPTAAVSLLIGDIAARRGDWRTALVRYRSAVVMVPRDAASYLRLGQAQEHLGDAAAAEASFARYRELTQR